MSTLFESSLPGLELVHRGKVRDVYAIDASTAMSVEGNWIRITSTGDEDFDPDDWPVVPSDFTFTLELLRQPEVTAITPGAITAGMNAIHFQNYDQFVTELENTGWIDLTYQEVINSR